MKKFIGLLIVLILGIIIGFVLFAYVPLGFRYEYLLIGNGFFYRVDKFTGTIVSCRPKDMALSKLECEKVYDF